MKSYFDAGVKYYFDADTKFYFDSGMNFYFEAGMNFRISPATPEIGMVWSHTRPGPVIRVLNTPSPPNTIFFSPGTVLISMLQVASIAARYPVSTMIC